jgi:hypothetical protein
MENEYSRLSDYAKEQLNLWVMAMGCDDKTLAKDSFRKVIFYLELMARKMGYKEHIYQEEVIACDGVLYNLRNIQELLE